MSCVDYVCGIMLQRDVLMKRVVMWWRETANYGVVGKHLKDAYE